MERKKVYIGQDNGVTSTIGILCEGGPPILLHTPVKKMQDYTSTKKQISRLDVEQYFSILKKYSDSSLYQTKILLETPMCNPKMFRATESALRCFEAMWIAIEILKLPHEFTISKTWQKELLPTGVKGADELKKASLDIGNRLFPQFQEFKHPDRDGLLIALWAQKHNL
jgi:hypothetical protein